MKTIHIFGYEITIKKLILSLNNLRIEDVEKIAMKSQSYLDGARKVIRIRAVREILPEATLRQAFDWVNSHFEE